MQQRKVKDEEVTIIKEDGLWCVIRSNNTKMGSCSSLRETVSVCSNYIIMNLDYVLTELINNNVK